MADNTLQLFVGVDIAAKTAEVAVLANGRRAQRCFSIDQSAAGYAELVRRLKASTVAPQLTKLVMEATGNYWVQLAVYLHEQGYLLAVVNPRRARRFSEALELPGKTDTLDAIALAQLGAKLELPLWTPPAAVYHELNQRLAERDDLISQRQVLRNQLHALSCLSNPVPATIERKQVVIALIEQQIEQIEAELKSALLTDEAWEHSATLLQSIKGVGLITAIALLVTTLNFTACADAAAASRYAGLVPLPTKSGTSVWGPPRIGHRGNARLRTALYMASMSAAQHNPAVRELYQRLLAAGKATKAARCAAARKLLHIAWAVVTKNQPWDAEYGKKLVATP